MNLTPELQISINESNLCLDYDCYLMQLQQLKKANYFCIFAKTKWVIIDWRILHIFWRNLLVPFIGSFFKMRLN